MNDKNSIIEYYRKNICIAINNYTFKQAGITCHAMPTWERCMQGHIGITPSTTSKQHAEKIFLLGEHLRDVFYSTKDTTSTGRNQGELSSGGYLWERLVAYYLNYCLANTRTVVFTGATSFDAIKTAVTFNDMDSTSEVDLLALTFPDVPEFTNAINNVKYNLQVTYPTPEATPTQLEFIHNNRLGIKTITEKLANYFISEYYSDMEIHVIQCKTNWNDIIQTPMLWSLVYYLSRDNITLPTGSNIRFGSGLYTLPRLKSFSYSFVTVPTQNNGKYEPNPIKRAKLEADFDDKFSETNLPVKRAKMIRGGYYWGLPKHNSIYPINELFNTNLNTGYTGHIVDNIQDNIDHNRYNTDYDYFCHI